MTPARSSKISPGFDVFSNEAGVARWSANRINPDTRDKTRRERGRDLISKDSYLKFLFQLLDALLVIFAPENEEQGQG
jgi:hypothetical protein